MLAVLFLAGATAVLMLEKSQSASAARGVTPAELAASIAHEVNQPLSAMTAHGQACLRWFDRDVPDVEAARQSVQQMLDNGTRAADIIASMSALARGAAPAPVLTDINQVLGSILSRVEGEIAANGIEVALNLKDRVPRIIAGRTELEQVLQNLVINAVQALADVNGPRRLTISSRAARRERQVVVEVRDNGPGFTAACSSRLFEPFFTTKAQGTGMGLAICRSIVASMGGHVDARNNSDGRGACLTLRLNAARPEGLAA
ncbi:sensor histidine kinase [Sphingomonas sp. M1-B02]|uniref:sensor histidine kinase n=1 Tax=Sphingomonas sp. M1-B02 TaxID=3114300 RepID=UPI00223EE801|nr:ATP-binding protein [Sphingomonas sp. S6-11]UZK66307.1 ATP-binding protein [Sphingomonas sp. S6-11]